MFFLIVGTSAASNISVVFGLLVLGVFARNRLLLMLVALLISIGLVILPPDSILKVLAPGKSETAIETLSGRSWLWGLYIDEVMKSPWLGHGFAASTRTLSFYSINTHNGLLAVVLGTGFIGLTVFAIFLLRVGREALVILRGTAQQGFGASIAIATGLLNNMSISLLGEHWVPATMGIVLFLVLQFRFVQFQTHKLPDYAAVLSHQCDARQ
jgi:O-antigen ligase